MYSTAQEEYKLVRNGHPGCTGLKGQVSGLGGRRLLCCRHGFLSIVFCIMILKPALQYPVHYSVSLLLWRNGLGLETLSFSVSISGPTSCLLPQCRRRGASMALFSDSVSVGTGAVMFPGALTAFIHAVTELLTLSALCAWHCAVPHWGSLPACPAAASLSQPLELFV